MTELSIIPILENSADGPIITSEEFSLRTGVDHRSVLQTIGQRTAELEAFGQVAFEMRLTGKAGSDVRTALLNEPQALLLINFVRNTDQIVEAKIGIIQAFMTMKQVLASPPARFVQETLFTNEYFGFQIGEPVMDLPPKPLYGRDRPFNPVTAKYDLIAKAVREANGAWVPVTFNGWTDARYKELMRGIRYGHRKSFPRGQFNADIREGKLYVRHSKELVS